MYGKHLAAGVSALRLKLSTRGAVIAVIFFAVLIASLSIGTVQIPPMTVAAIILSQVPYLGAHFASGFTQVQYEIVVLLREPQILGAVVIGASLGVGGAVIQSIFKNPITEPYVIGISSGAALGAVLAIAGSIYIFGAYSVGGMAFIFSLLVVFLVYFVSIRRGKVPMVYLLLMGIAVSLFVSAIVAFLLFSNIRLQGAVFFWLLGSLQEMTWPKVELIAGINILMIMVSLLYSRELDAFQMGEEYAASVGVSVERTKILLITTITLGVSSCVAVAGLIGFVGLVIPHVSRIIFGGSNRNVIPASAVLGSVFLLISEDIAHSRLFGGEVIPIGIITSLIGVPFFMFLMVRLAGGFYES